MVKLTKIYTRTGDKGDEDWYDDAHVEDEEDEAYHWQRPIRAHAPGERTR